MSDPSPTNLTDRISYLRDRKKGSQSIKNPQPKQLKSSRRGKSISERRFATDYFMLFVYSLLTIAMLSQFILIAWLEII